VLIPASSGGARRRPQTAEESLRALRKDIETEGRPTQVQDLAEIKELLTRGAGAPAQPDIV
jgi:hypothetical protein